MKIYVDESLLGEKEKAKKTAKKFAVGYLIFFFLIFAFVIGMMILGFTRFISAQKEFDKFDSSNSVSVKDIK